MDWIFFNLFSTKYGVKIIKENQMFAQNQQKCGELLIEKNVVYYFVMLYYYMIISNQFNE
jgi:hypothetical protein